MDLISGIAIIAPHEVQAIAVPILRHHAPDTLARTPAHITVLFPFVPIEDLREACIKLRAVCSDYAPFDITMDGYGHFPRFTYMKPADPEPIRALFRKIYGAFPECAPYGGAFGDEIVPHMTVAQFATEAEQAAAVLPPYEPVTFRATRLHVLYGNKDAGLPWIPYDVVPLGG